MPKLALERMGAVSDRLKFRAWNPSVGKFTYWESYDIVFDFEHRPLLGIQQAEGSNTYLSEYEAPEQCTGLQDRNGKLIYEGDILDTNDSITTVEWHAPCFRGFQYVKGEFNQAQTEVIGHIHTVEPTWGGGEA